MTSTSKNDHPDAFHSPGWDWEAQTPVVDGKIVDRKTGEVRTAGQDQEYIGPPAVDIVIMSLHENTNGIIYRSQRPFPVEKLLCNIMRVVHDRKLELDSLTATKYAIRIVLEHGLTRKELLEVTDLMSNGIWDEV